MSPTIQGGELASAGPLLGAEGLLDGGAAALPVPSVVGCSVVTVTDRDTGGLAVMRSVAPSGWEVPLGPRPEEFTAKGEGGTGYGGGLGAGDLFRLGSPSLAKERSLLAADNAFLQRLDPSGSLYSGAEGPGDAGLFSLSCLAAALAGTANHKAPGTDGLPYEVYKVLWVFGPLLLDAIVA